LLLADESGRAVLAANHAIQQAEHADIVLMDAPELKVRFPWLETSDLAAGAFGRSGEGWFDAHSLLELLRRGARERGAVYLHGRKATASSAASRLRPMPTRAPRISTWTTICSKRPFGRRSRTACRRWKRSSSCAAGPGTTTSTRSTRTR